MSRTHRISAKVSYIDGRKNDNLQAGKNFVIGMVSEVGERSWQDKELMM